MNNHEIIIIINKIKDLNIGSVEIVKIQAFGTYIMIDLQNIY